MWNLTDYTNEHIYQAKTDSQTKRTGRDFQGEEGTEEGRTGSLGQQIQAIIQRINKQEGILYSNPVINHSRKEYEKEY